MWRIPSFHSLAPSFPPPSCACVCVCVCVCACLCVCLCVCVCLQSLISYTYTSSHKHSDSFLQSRYSHFRIQSLKHTHTHLHTHAHILTHPHQRRWLSTLPLHSASLSLTSPHSQASPPTPTPTPSTPQFWAALRTVYDYKIALDGHPELLSKIHGRVAKRWYCLLPSVDTAHTLAHCCGCELVAQPRTHTGDTQPALQHHFRLVLPHTQRTYSHSPSQRSSFYRHLPRLVLPHTRRAFNRSTRLSSATSLLLSCLTHSAHTNTQPVATPVAGLTKCQSDPSSTAVSILPATALHSNPLPPPNPTPGTTCAASMAGCTSSSARACP